MPPRRSHRKSRNGCMQCKQRRVKCDESRPCSNCTKRGIACIYDHGSKSPSVIDVPRNSQTRSSYHSEDPSSRHGTPAVNQIDWFSTLDEKIAGTASILREWSRQDPELMHHFTLYTSQTISERKEIQDVWQIEVPKMAYSYGFLMHGILSLSALHLSHLKPENYGDYMTSSRIHLTFGLRTFVRVLPSPTAENCSALFSFCSVIMIYTYGCPMESNETDTADLLNNLIEVFRVSRGTLIIMPYLKSMRHNGLEPLFRQEYNLPISSKRARKNNLFDGVDEQLDKLSQYIESEPLDPEDKVIGQQALAALSSSFEAFESADLPLECGMAFFWPLSVHEGKYFAFKTAVLD
ncbi:hypothetical protein UA08_07075 [Talaromyces atroroseus]|uniref:Zn(2)-C6 fungal-type domain-containing protein n=1 Tax=Talaromyces atroroseus TaxID=1441469 RepID=A0A225AAA4_TALAT|nr:hypothetical protein UA08_07075 [Talaromyces atroroseus]OKL57772.1 hypothetical protein UA08_07075 [Talaromyces atroroseus]